jgi:hypothetical protein
MIKTAFHPELVDITWKFCGVALFQLGLMAGLALVDDAPDGGLDLALLVSLMMPILGAMLIGRTRSRTVATAMLGFLLVRSAWRIADFEDDPLFYLQEVSDVLLALLAAWQARLCWIIAGREEIRYGRIVTKMLGRLA